jgi:DNA-binding transcriptional LysR family regulator
MQLEALKIFCDVVRWASFSRGAAENDVSQSSASQAVHQLEVRLGVKLLDRSKRPLVTTPHGRVFYEGCKELVGRYLELETRVRALENEHNVVGTVRVAAIYSVGLAHLSRDVERFRALYPGADIRLEYLHPTRVIESVKSGHAALGLISFPRKFPELTVLPWRDEEMAVVVNPRHRFAGERSLDIGRLDGERFIAFDADLRIRKHIDKYLRKHGIQVEVQLEFDNIENIKCAVSELPTGLSILPLPTLERELEAGTLVALPLRDHRLTRPLAIIHRGTSSLSLTACRFLESLTGGGRERAPLAAASSAEASTA